LRFRSDGNTSKQRSIRHADKLAFAYRKATNTNIDIPHPITTMDDDGEQHDLTFEELDAFSRFPFSDGQLFLAMMTADVKFSPRYAKVFIRTKRLYMLNEDLEIIDLTTDVGTGSNSSTPFSTPQKKHKLDCDELDAL
jgi:hypothetical protein